MSRKLKRQFKKMDRMLDKWGFDNDDPIIGRNKISAEVEYAGIDFEITSLKGHTRIIHDHGITTVNKLSIEELTSIIQTI